jgi:DNA-binding NtrC family response regulator
MLKPSTVVLFGGFLDEATEIERLARELGWSTAITTTRPGLREIANDYSIMGILIDTRGGRLCEMVDSIRAVDPLSRLVVCRGFGDPDCADELPMVEAFDALFLPLSSSELRQSLGFLACAAARDQERQRTSRLRLLPRIERRAPRTMKATA